VVYDEDTGMWNIDIKYSILRKCCVKYANRLFPVLNDGDEKKTFDSIFNTCIKTIISLAPVNDEFFNNDEQIGFLLFNNGVLNMKKFELLPFDTKYRFTKKINRDFDVSRDYSKGYKQLFDRLYNKQFTDTLKRDYFLQLLSRGIAGEYKDRVFGTMIGETSCGKGKQTSLLKNAFEGYISFFNGEELLVKNNASPDVSRSVSFIQKIFDTRVSISNELDIRQQNGKSIVGMNCNLIKKLTGTDTIITRQIYLTEMETVNKSRPFFLLNDIPSTQGVDDAYIKRANYIEYDRSSKPNLTCDDDMFFQQDDSIDDFVNDIFTIDSFIYLICKYYAESCSNMIPKPDCVIATTNERTGYNNANSYFEDNYSVCKADDVKKYVKKDKNDKGLWTVNWKTMEEDSFDYFIKLDDMYTEYINSGNSCTKTEFTKRVRKQFPHVVVTVRKIYSKTVTCYVGIRKQRDNDEESDDE
jgi:phage/plasmid-associated DNA primase